VFVRTWFNLKCISKFNPYRTDSVLAIKTNRVELYGAIIILF